MENDELTAEEPQILRENQFMMTFVADGFVSEGPTTEESDQQ